jgi:hypothetical protein
MDLSEVNLFMVDLTGADLAGAHLSGANLGGAILAGANLAGVILAGASLYGADLTRADLAGATLFATDLMEANLREANLHGAYLLRTVLGGVDFTETKGLEQCAHGGPSIIDHRTFQKSGPLPLKFLRGIGLPDNLIELLNQPVQLYSCFISYSTKDQEFVDRLCKDLEDKGVRYYVAPYHMRIGAKIIDALDEAIRRHDKVILILSESAIASDWVEGEVTRSLDEERERDRTVLLPIRLDDVAMQSSKPWTRLLRGQRNIGDFTRWKDHDSYRKSFDRLICDLTVQQAPKGP